MTIITLKKEINGTIYNVFKETSNCLYVMANETPTIYSKKTKQFIKGGGEIKTKNNRKHGGGYNR